MPDTSARSQAEPDDELAPAAAGDAKLQRWVDLLAALLSRSLPAGFEDLALQVPYYEARLRAAERAGDAKRREAMVESLKRTFERDKKELRLLGVPIESLPDEQGNESGSYRLRRKDFYLPYLCFAVPGRKLSEPPKTKHWAYQALTQLTFEPDELQAVIDAAAYVRSLGDPLLRADVDSALRKLAVDLPVDAATISPDEPQVVLPRTRPDVGVFEALGDALLRRKSASFTYHAMSSNRTARREVEPYGLFFLNGHWYLAARDRTRPGGAPRNFRLDRVRDVQVSGKRPRTPDYDIPPTFRLREHARSRQAWELGDGDPVEVVVEFRGTSGPTTAAAKLGTTIEAHTDRRSFSVRRPDAFVRWLLSFAGEVVPVVPNDLVALFQQEVARTRDVYATDSAIPCDPDSRRISPSRKPAQQAVAWQPRGAAAQFRRLLHVVPQIADGEEHSLAGVAERVGTDAETLWSDLHSLAARYDVPGGFIEGVKIFLEPDRVSAVSNHFLRPMRLTVSELCALDLGLAVLRQHRAPDEHGVIDQTRERLRKVIAKLPDDPIPDGLYAASLGDAGGTVYLATVRAALRERRKLRLMYRKSGSPTASERVVCPCALVTSSGMLYLVAHCDPGAGLRVFRMDRVEGAETLDETFEAPAEFSLDVVLHEGRVFYNEQPGVMVVRYSPRVARWIAEREGLELDADGGLVMEHPLADWEWAMRHVLQYGPEAEVLEPAGLRDRLRERLTQMEATDAH